MKKIKRYFVFLFVATIFLLLGGCKKDPLAKYENMFKNGNVTLQVWTYYNNAQKTAFDEIVANFNRTVGEQKNIKVAHTAFGTTSSLAEAITLSAEKVAGAKPMPNIFQSYADDLMNLDYKYNNVAALDKYFTKTEKNNYINGLLDEGRYDKDKNMKLIPVAKSTEVFMLNKTDWDKYVAISNAKLSDLETIEGIVAASADYYAKTGKALYGRDTIANLIYVSAVSLNKPLFSIDQETNVATPTLDRELFQKLYDNHYVPFVKGHFATQSRFHTGDIETGLVLGCVGSTAGISYFPNKIALTDNRDEDYAIDGYVAAPPIFKGGEKYVVSQGAGMAVSKDEEKIEYASSVFLKYITNPANNIKLAVLMNYLPVTKDSLDYDLIKETFIKINLEDKEKEDNQTNRNEILENPKSQIALATYKSSIEVFKMYKTYSPKPFINSSAVRKILDNSIEGNKVAGMESFVNAADLIRLINQDIASGMSKEAATEKWLAGNFENWYSSLKVLVEEAARVK